MSNCSEHKKGAWKPKLGGKYYWIGSGHILKGVHKAIWQNSESDNSLWGKGEVFKSKAAAEFVYRSFHGQF